VHVAWRVRTKAVNAPGLPLECSGDHVELFAPSKGRAGAHTPLTSVLCAGGRAYDASPCGTCPAPSSACLARRTTGFRKARAVDFIGEGMIGRATSPARAIPLAKPVNTGGEYPIIYQAPPAHVTGWEGQGCD